MTLDLFPQPYNEVHFRRYWIVPSSSKFKGSCSLCKGEQWENPELERQRMEKKESKYSNIYAWLCDLATRSFASAAGNLVPFVQETDSATAADVLDLMRCKSGEWRLISVA